MQIEAWEVQANIMLARYYSSSIGRFLSADQEQFSLKHLVLPQRWNKYAYVRNNPLSLIDPDGFDDFAVFDMFQAGDFPTGYQRPDWGAITAAAKRNGHKVTVLSGAAANATAYAAARSTPGMHIVLAGHTVE